MFRFVGEGGSKDGSNVEHTKSYNHKKSESEDKTPKIPKTLPPEVEKVVFECMLIAAVAASDPCKEEEKEAKVTLGGI